VPADKHKGPDGLSRHEPAPGKEEDDDPEDWVDNALSLSTWVVSWLDPFPTDAHRIDALVLSLEVSDGDDDDFVQHNCSLAAIAALLRDASLPTLSPLTRLAPPAVFVHQLRPSTQKILTTTTTALTMTTAPAPAVATNMSCPTDLHRNYDTDVDPALEFVQANRPVSEVILSCLTDKHPAILCADSRCANVCGNVAQYALSLERLVHPLSFD